jgi:hypothetical protein
MEEGSTRMQCTPQKEPPNLRPKYRVLIFNLLIQNKMKYIVKTGLAGLKATELVTKAANIEVAMTGNAAFADPTPTLAELSAARVALEALIAESAKGTRSAIAARRDQEEVLAGLIRKLAAYVKLNATSEADILSAGFGIGKRRTAVGRLSQPTGLEALRTDSRGQVNVSWNAVSGKQHYILEMTTTDPSQAHTAWEVVAYTGKVRHTVDNLTPGTYYWFRITALGAAGASAHSDPAMVMAA